MIKLDPKAEINAEVIFSNLMKRKHMVTRFRLPYTAKQVYAMLYEACRVEVAHRHREFNATEQYKNTSLNVRLFNRSNVSYNLYTIFRTRLQEKQNRKVVVLTVNTTTSEEKGSLLALCVLTIWKQLRKSCFERIS